MRIQALKTLLDGNVKTKKGAIVEVDDHRGRQLVLKGYAVEIPEIEDSVAAPIAFVSEAPAALTTEPKDNVATKDKSADPFAAPLAGGQDGSEKPASSSEADQARPKRTYTRRKTAASDSSSSTTDTD